MVDRGKILEYMKAMICFLYIRRCTAPILSVYSLCHTHFHPRVHTSIGPNSKIIKPQPFANQCDT